MILFFMFLFKFLLNNSFLWLKAFLAIPILVLISVSHLPSLVMRGPRYLNCSCIFPSIVVFITPSPFLDTFMTSVFFIFTFMSYSFAVLFSPSISFCKPPSEPATIPWSMIIYKAYIFNYLSSDLDSLFDLFHSIHHHHFRID